MKKEKQLPAKTTFLVLVLIFLWCNFAIGQTTKQQQDSIAQLQKQADKYIADTVLLKTSLKEFQLFLYERTTGKEYNEMPFPQLYNFFIQTRLNEWIANRNKKPKQ